MKLVLSVFWVLLHTIAIQAQRTVHIQEYVYDSIDVRLADPFALARIELDIPSKGKVIARMEGDCISSMGDVITFGVSNTSVWLSNYGNTGIRIFDSLRNNNRYFHSLSFNVVPGKRTFSAYAHNWTDKNGTGIISVKGNFILEFIPENEDEILHNFKNLTIYPVNFNENLKLVDSISITVNESAKIHFAFDGRFYSRNDTEVMFVMNDKELLDNNAEIFHVHIPQISRLQNFSKHFIKEVGPGTHHFYVMCRKVQGNMIDSENAVYGTLMAKVFYDNENQNRLLADKSELHISPDGSVFKAGDISWTVPAKGKILLEYTGVTEMNQNQKMNISLNTQGSGLDVSEDLSLQTLHPNDKQNFFSFYRVYNVEEGNLKIEAFARPEGNISPMRFNGDLLVQYIADPVVSSIYEMTTNESDLKVYPNPAVEFIRFQIPEINSSGNLKMSIIDMTGRHFPVIDRENTATGFLNISRLKEGVYILQIEDGSSIYRNKFIKIN